MLGAAGSHLTNHLATSNDIVGIAAGLLVVIASVVKGPKVLDTWATKRVAKRASQHVNVPSLDREVKHLHERVGHIETDLGEIKAKLTNGSDRPIAELVHAIADKLGVET